MNNVVTFRASRKKALLLLFGSICFVALGVWISSEKPLIGWACAAFFALHVLVSLLMMLPNAMYLRLDEEGFEMRSLIRTHKIKWTDVEGFSNWFNTRREDDRDHLQPRVLAAANWTRSFSVAIGDGRCNSE